jgi:glucosamine 6-phosphate synthetase-like amidotransferase/phosphosugar isomerase protein
LANNFFTYFKAHPKTPIIFIVTDKQPDKQQMLADIELLVAKTDILPIMVTDIKDPATRERLVKLTDDRVFFVQRSGAALSALLCILPLQRLAFDLTIELGYHPDKPRNLAKELTTQ